MREPPSSRRCNPFGEYEAPLPPTILGRLGRHAFAGIHFLGGKQALVGKGTALIAIRFAKLIGEYIRADIK